jgi:hypothetical protein
MEIENIQAGALVVAPDKLPGFNQRELGWGQSYDATDLFRMSPYFTLEKAWHFIAFSLLTVSLFIYRAPINHSFGVPEWIENLEFLIVRTKVFMTVCSLTYWEMYRRSFKVEVNGFRLNIIRGVFQQEIITIHVLPHTTFYVDRHSWLDALLGTATLKIVAPNVEKPIKIEFLPVDKAHQARNFLSNQADKQLYINMEQ